MTGRLKNFRDFGIGPVDLAEPPAVVRAVLPTGHVVGQYVFTAMVSLLGLGLAAVFGFTFPFPASLPGAVAPVVLVALFIRRATRNDYRWVELVSRTIRAKQLYTGRIIERDISEIEDVLTLVFQVRTSAIRLTEQWLGRVRGVMLRFADGRTPILINRIDPKMRNSQELIEAVLYRLSERGALDFEVVDFDGKPLLRRVYVRGEMSAASGPERKTATG